MTPVSTVAAAIIRKRVPTAENLTGLVDHKRKLKAIGLAFIF